MPSISRIALPASLFQSTQQFTAAATLVEIWISLRQLIFSIHAAVLKLLRPDPVVPLRFAPAVSIHVAVFDCRDWNNTQLQAQQAQMFQSTQQFVTAATGRCYRLPARCVSSFNPRSSLWLLRLPICKSLVVRRWDLVLREGDIPDKGNCTCFTAPQCQRTCLTSTYGLRELTATGVFTWALANALYLLDNLYRCWCITN